MTMSYVFDYVICTSSTHPQETHLVSQMLDKWSVQKRKDTCEQHSNYRVETRSLKETKYTKDYTVQRMNANTYPLFPSDVTRPSRLREVRQVFQKAFPITKTKWRTSYYQTFILMGKSAVPTSSVQAQLWAVTHVVGSGRHWIWGNGGGDIEPPPKKQLIMRISDLECFSDKYFSSIIYNSYIDTFLHDLNWQ